MRESGTALHARLAPAVIFSTSKPRACRAYRSVEGNRGAFALYRVSNGVAEFLVISLWDSIAAIQRFVGGDDISKAIYFPEDRQYLGFPEPKVVHYELAAGRIQAA